MYLCGAKEERTVKINIGGKEVELDVDLAKLKEEYAIEVNNLVRSMKLQNVQKGEYRRLTFESVYKTYEEYRKRYGILDEGIDIEELKLELKEELKRVGLSIEKEGRYEYIEKY